MSKETKVCLITLGLFVSALMLPGGAQIAGASSALGKKGGYFVRRDLVANGSISAEQVDGSLLNGWSMAFSGSMPAKRMPAAPTGIVANRTASFVVSLGGLAAPARFIFASEDGTIRARIPADPPPRTAIVVVDRSPAGAVYKGLALASTPAGDRLYATNFYGGIVEVFDGSFAPVSTEGGFLDPAIPAGYAPFGIRAIGDTLYVTYAKQDGAHRQAVTGKHSGFVSAFTTDGRFLRRVASRGKLNAPWGLAMAPSGFGGFSDKLLVGNYGDGRIIGYRFDADEDDDHESDWSEWWDGWRDWGGSGVYLSEKGRRITIDGLWVIDFDSGAGAGPASALFFNAGLAGEARALFGRIDFVPSDG